MLKADYNIPMFGLAKQLEEIFLPNQEESILLDRKSPALHLIQRIRDEAHRFGITHHRDLRQKAGMHSTLEDIPGIGATRRLSLIHILSVWHTSSGWGMKKEPKRRYARRHSSACLSD